MLSSTVTTVSATSSFNTSSSSSIYYYVLKNIGTGKYLNVKGNSSANNTNITLWQKDGTSGQNFALYYDSTNKGYVIVPECSTSRAVNIYGSSASNNLNVCTWTKTGHSTQAWILKSVSGGYVIQSANNTNYVLTASGSSNGSNICIQKYSSSNKNQVLALSLQKTVKSGGTCVSSSSSSSSKTLSINWTYINGTGKQTVSGPCLCYSLAYCRDILDSKTHSWTEYRYSSSSYAAVASKASYVQKTATSTSAVYKAIYEQIKAGKPVVIRVGYLKGRSSGTHYVTVVGYTNVTSTSNLSASNFIIIDPLVGTKAENMGTVGYSLGKDSNGKYNYYVAT